MIMHIQSRSIVRTVYSSIFRDIDAYVATLTRARQVVGEDSPDFF